MELAQYGEKALVIHGETIAWKENLKQLGGKFNKNLSVGPGWIFSRRDEDRLIEFMNNVKNGEIEPFAEKATNTTVLPKILPRSSPTKILPIIQPRTSPVKSQTPSVIQSLPNKPLTVNFPNAFVAADGINYQIVMYTVPLPHVGQTVTVATDNIETYVVHSIENNDAITLKGKLDNLVQVPGDNLVQGPGEALPRLIKAVIISGQWKLLNEIDNHTVTFHV